MLLGGRKYSLNAQPGYDNSEYLNENIRNSVMAYTRDKNMSIVMYKDFVKFLGEKGIVAKVEFPPVPINTFERLMYIAKYFHEADSKISDLSEKLWVSDRTISNDLKKLQGDDPIQVCGKKFCIPDTERKNGTLKFESTAHPIFLTENLTQVMVLLKGLKKMSEDDLYKNYAIESASEIWNQLSDYAHRRIKVVLSDLSSEDLSWYESLESERTDSFYTEKKCSTINNSGTAVVMYCIKNEKKFFVEYQETEDNVVYYKDCVVDGYGEDGKSIIVTCSAGKKELILSKILKSAHTVEELL